MKFKTNITFLFLWLLVSTDAAAHGGEGVIAFIVFVSIAAYISLIMALIWLVIAFIGGLLFSALLAWRLVRVRGWSDPEVSFYTEIIKLKRSVMA